MFCEFKGLGGDVRTVYFDGDQHLFFGDRHGVDLLVVTMSKILSQLGCLLGFSISLLNQFGCVD